MQAFAGVAGVYEQARPSYPPEAVSWIVERAGLGPGTVICDLAAGTGKLTRLLIPSGAHVIAVEPVREMRQQLEASVAGVGALEGTAESLPLADASVDCVTVAQASTGSTTAGRFQSSPARSGQAARSRSSGTCATPATRWWRR
jgi:SAM-dependent methyltransferase